MKLRRVALASLLVLAAALPIFAQAPPAAMIRTMTYAEAVKQAGLVLPKSIPSFIPKEAIQQAIVTVLSVPGSNGPHEFITIPGYAQIRVASPSSADGFTGIGSEYRPGASLLHRWVLGGESSEGTALYRMGDILFVTWQSSDLKVFFVDALSTAVDSDKLMELAKSLQ